MKRTLRISARPGASAAAAALLALLAIVASAPPGPALPLELDPPSPVPDVVAGFTVAPFAAISEGEHITALAFGPGDADGQDLYVTLRTGQVQRIPVVWTAAGPVALPAETVAAGFDVPLGLAFVGDAMFVSDIRLDGPESGRADGRVTMLLGGERRVVVDGLPNGMHNTNHLRVGPDGRLHIANGNSNDNGKRGLPDVFPYSGAILSVDPAEVAASPAVLRWDDAAGNDIPLPAIAGHPRNADFHAKVRVVASGFRNAFGVAFGPTGIPYTAMNGAEDPHSQDVLFRIVPGTDYGFPRCYHQGAPGSVEVEVVPNPTYPGADCAGVPPADATLGWHACATGLDVPAPGAGPAAFPGPWARSVYVAQCGAYHVHLDDPPSTSNYGHRVVRVALDEDGKATSVSDFLLGTALATDVLFGPDGALYVAMFAAVLRVAPALPGVPEGATPAALPAALPAAG